MYENFDPFLARDTWHTSHPLDDQAFYRCLKKVIADPNFSPETMGEYFLAKKGSHFEQRIDSLTAKAWAIREYLVAVA